MTLSENPMFGVMIGQQIGNNAQADAELIKSRSDERIASKQADAAVLIVERLKSDLNELDGNSFTFESALAGMRGVVRELLAELRKSDPSHPLLDKTVRDQIYDGAKAAQVERMTGMGWEERFKRAREHQNAVYDAPATKSGPEQIDITQNHALRHQAQVPDHVTDREKLLTLVAALASELQRTTPDSEILQGNAARIIFEEFLLAEAIRLEQRAGRSM